MNKAVIEVYRANEKPYGAFSNLYRREIEIAGLRFPTNEHAYQFLKPRDTRVRDWLMAAPAPSLVALAAHAMPGDEADRTRSWAGRRMHCWDSTSALASRYCATRGCSNDKVPNASSMPIYAICCCPLRTRRLLKSSNG